MIKYHLVDLQKKIKRLIKKGTFENKFIVLFGAAANLKSLHELLKEKNIKIDAVIDNDSKKIGKYSMGIKVQSPKDLLSDFKDNAVILIYSIFWNDMIRQLEAMGYKKKVHIFDLSYINMKANEKLRFFLSSTHYRYKGYRYLKKINKKYPNSKKMFIAPYTGTGDIYLIGLFFYQYLEQNNIDDYVFILVGKACQKVAQIFSIKNIEVVTAESSKASIIIDTLVFLNQDKDLLILNDSWASTHMNIIQWIRGYKGLNFTEMFRHFVFNLDENAEYMLPKSTNNSEEIEKIFEKYNLKIGKTVVLSPYSNTLFKVLDSTWEFLAKSFFDAGYTVCTNSCGEKEPAVKGTPAVFFPLTYAKQFMDMAGGFIGVRSGLCDVISLSSCKKAVLYEKDGYFFESTTFEYFSLKEMKLCDDALELEYNNENKDKCIIDILNFFEI